VKEAGTGQRAGRRRPASQGLIALILGVPVALAVILVAVSSPCPDRGLPRRRRASRRPA
jgi:hypothetical protein